MAEKKEIFDLLKPAAEMGEVAVAPEMVQKWLGEDIDVMDMVAEMIKAEGVEYTYGICAGNEITAEMHFNRAGIKHVQVRHEQTAPFIAEAQARMTGRPSPGIALIGPGTGITNAATGIVQALCAQAPTVIIACTDEMWADNVIFGQGISRAYKIYGHGGLTKYTTRVNNPMALPFEVKRAFRAAMTPPLGPVCVELPGEYQNIVWHRGPRARFLVGFNPMTWTARTERPKTMAPPDDVDRMMKWLFEAEKPAVIAGEGVVYDDAIPELQEFARLSGIPTHCRRSARGAISEFDPLNCGGRARGAMMRGSERSVVIGLKIGYLELFGFPPFWNDMGLYAQIQQCRENTCMQLATEHELTGNLKVILRQMIDWCKGNGKTEPPEKWNEWRQSIAQAKGKYEQRSIEREKKGEGKMPLHPDVAGKLIVEFLHEELDDDYYSSIDGFTAATYYSDWQKVKFAPSILDASDTIGFGQGPGQAIAAGLASNRSKPIIAVMGDGCIGAGGMEIEVASRFNIPAVFIHFNNNYIVTGSQYFVTGALSPSGIPLQDTWATLPNIRYDKMMAEFGCHPELVRRDAEMKPALKRSLDFVRDKSRPAFIEVFIDPDVLQEIWGTFLFQMCLGFLEWEDLNPRLKEIMNELWDRRLALLSDAWTHPSWAKGIQKMREELGNK